eukprot:3752761-Pyramimonas_sp.AAC.1
MQGHGKMTRPDGSWYEGSWMKSLKHGRGTEVLDGGDKYVGSYVNGVRCGQGKYENVSTDGSVYEGTWANDAYHGKGTELRLDGSKYFGCWKDCERSGWGIQYDRGGSVEQTGVWQAGKLKQKWCRAVVQICLWCGLQ